jgi:hypothetical protein
MRGRFTALLFEAPSVAGKFSFHVLIIKRSNQVKLVQMNPLYVLKFIQICRNTKKTFRSACKSIKLNVCFCLASVFMKMVLH